jgi:uncharacterized Zn finger protein
MAWYSWAPYVPVAERRRRAKKKMESLRKRGVDIRPIEIKGRKIAKTFWGQAWCDHLEGFSDFENRLPRGRTYVRNGSVCHLAIAQGNVEAKVSGSKLYNLSIRIKTLQPEKWNGVKGRCAGQIGSLLELLQGNLSDHVMEVVTDRQEGLFPLPGEISFDCDCPDWAVMCKHVAAVLYGIGARLDENPELLFTLRGVNHEELIDTDAEAALGAATRSGKSKRLAADDLSDVFGIDIDVDRSSDSADSARVTPPATPGKKAKENARPATQEAKGATKKKTPKKKSTRRPAKKTVARKKSAKKTVAPRKPGRTIVKKTVKQKTPKTAENATGGKQSEKKTAKPRAR